MRISDWSSDVCSSDLMLVFWYSQSSNISPPVCMAAFAGASIAKSDPMRTGFTALKFSAFLFIIPLLFIYTPIMMPEGLTVQAAQKSDEPRGGKGGGS